MRYIIEKFEEDGNVIYIVVEISKSMFDMDIYKFNTYEEVEEYLRKRLK